ncbi:hypothetical protein DSO57_1015502 [Entomophthora muscae]|uniref:Uncharacterized protein n=1 Tax=Entomophthora muscae TaxID=34485 RepID=A0ACC2UQY5_9FUNG|nr:hypothetical protein DSO57_1015502 [Entomophthora muscae]
MQEPIFTWINTTIFSRLYHPPGFAPIPLVTPVCALDLEFYHPHHLDLPTGCSRGQIPTTVKEIRATTPFPDALPAHDFSKLGFVYLTVLGLTNQVMPHPRNWHPWATAANHLVRMAHILHMAFQAWPASPEGSIWTQLWGLAELYRCPRSSKKLHPPSDHPSPMS